MKLRTAFCVLLASAGLALAQPYVISTFAGGAAPPTPVTGTKASVGPVNGVAVDAASNVYFSSGLACIFKMDTTGTVTRYAGTCRPGYSGDGGAAVNAQMFNPTGLAWDSSGDLYIADAYPGNRIRMVSPSGVITTVAGTGIGGSPGDGGTATEADLLINAETGVAVDGSGNLYIVSTSCNCVRKVSAGSGTISIIAGSAALGPGGFSGDGQPASSAQLNRPSGVAVDSAGNVYVADQSNLRVRKISTSGIITTVAGNGKLTPLGDNGPATSAAVTPENVFVDASGNLYITDQSNGRIREVAAATGTITTVAGGGSGGPFTFSGDGGLASSATFNQPAAAVADSAGNLFIADQGNSRLRKVSAANGKIATVAGDGAAFSGDNGPATGAQLHFAASVAANAAGNVYIADARNNRVRKVANGIITTVAGNGIAEPFSNIPGPAPGDGGPATSAELNDPYAVALDSSGNLYIADTGAFRIRRVTPDGTISTFAGTGAEGYSGDGGQAAKAQLSLVYGLAFDSAGNLYLADEQNRVIRKISPGGTITTFAGNGMQGYLGDGGQATNAELNYPWAVAADSNGNVYIADTAACVVRRVGPDGNISTFAGDGNCYPTVNGGDGGPAAQASLAPDGLAVDSAGDVYIGDVASERVRMVSAATGIISTVAGAPVLDGFPATYSGDGGIATNAGFAGPVGLAIGPGGTILVGDASDNAVRLVTPDGPTGLTITGGNNQTGQVGWTLPYPLQAQVSGSARVPVPGVTVNFAATSGAATVAESVVTDASGTATAPLTLGASAGAVTVTASIGGMPPVQFTATAIPAPASGLTCTINAQPSITSVNSATDFGGFSSFAPGSWIEIKGSNLAVDTRLWAGSDFQAANAPTSLDSSIVTIDGHAAFVDYISGGQINAQVPADSNVGPVKITVTTCAGASQPFTGQLAPIEAGLLAPASFYVPGNPPELAASKQYLVALFQDGVTFVGNSGLIPGVPFRPAAPEDTITAYGIGFGTVSPPVAPGTIVSQSNNIPNFFLSFGTTPATVTYAGLAPYAVGLYQFNIVVPQVADGDYQINVSVGSTQVPQTVYLTVHQ